MAVKPTKQQLENRNIAADGGTPVETFDSDSFISAAASRLLSTSGIISSEDTALESKITTIQAGIETGLEASTERIESAFGREAEFQSGQFAQERTSVREAQRGFAVNTAALRQLDERTEKSLRDLEQRKQELVLAGEAAASEQITNLQIKEIEFQQQARQRVFTNLLALSQFGLQAKQEERLGRQQSFVERSTVAKIGLEFGLEVSEGTTLESIVALAAPRANTKRQAELAKLLADTRRANAEASKAESGIDFTLDDMVATSLASRVRQMIANGESGQAEALLASILSQQGEVGFALVKAKQAELGEIEFSDENNEKDIIAALDEGKTQGVILDSIQQDIRRTPSQVDSAVKFLSEETEKRRKERAGRTAVGVGISIGEATLKFSEAIGKFFSLPEDF